MILSEIREEVRDNIQEVAGIDGAIFSDPLLNRHIIREILSLSSKDIYLEEIWETTLDPTLDYSDGISLPDSTIKVESVERNDGTTTTPFWNPINGVDNYQGALFLPYTPTTIQDLRIKIRKAFAVPADNTIDTEVPDDKIEIVIWGTTIRCYRILIGYLRGSQSWDSTTKPGDLQIYSIIAFLKEARDYYKELVQQYHTDPRPREIDLTS